MGSGGKRVCPDRNFQPVHLLTAWTFPDKTPNIMAHTRPISIEFSLLKQTYTAIHTMEPRQTVRPILGGAIGRGRADRWRAGRKQLAACRIAGRDRLVADGSRYDANRQHVDGPQSSSGGSIECCGDGCVGRYGGVCSVS